MSTVKKSSLKKKRQDASLEEQNMLQAALAASQLTNGAATGAAAPESEMKLSENEVLYQNGASTELFAAVEECRWTEAFELLDCAPELAKVWVKSTGTENTTFGWSLWRRLPIHEACRRQAPAWFVAALIQAHPASVRETTQFGSLPLHLAVEMGAAPEVVNLLLVNYFAGICHKDNSGRTPEMACRQAEDLCTNEEDRTHVQESLRNAARNWKEQEDALQARMEALQQQHEDNVAALQKKHEEEIQYQLEQQRELQKQLARMEGGILQYREDRKQLEKTLSNHHVEKEKWQDVLEQREELLTTLKEEAEENMALMVSLKKQLQDKTHYCNRLEYRAATLEHDLISLTMLQRDAISVSMQEAEEDLAKMMESQEQLQGQLQGQMEGLTLLLSERGIELPPVNAPPPPEPVLKVDEGHVAEVTLAAANAAKSAIEQAEYEELEKSVIGEMEDTVSHQESSLELQNNSSSLEHQLSRELKDATTTTSGDVAEEEEEEEKKEAEEAEKLKRRSPTRRKRDMRRMLV